MKLVRMSTSNVSKAIAPNNGCMQPPLLFAPRSSDHEKQETPRSENPAAPRVDGSKSHAKLNTSSENVANSNAPASRYPSPQATGHNTDDARKDPAKRTSSERSQGELDPVVTILESMKTAGNPLSTRDAVSAKADSEKHSPFAVVRADGTRVPLLDGDTESANCEIAHEIPQSPCLVREKMNMKDILEDIRLEAARVQAKLVSTASTEAYELMNLLQKRVEVYIRDFEGPEEAQLAKRSCSPSTDSGSSRSPSDSGSTKSTPISPQEIDFKPPMQNFVETVQSHAMMIGQLTGVPNQPQGAEFYSVYPPMHQMIPPYQIQHCMPVEYYGASPHLTNRVLDSAPPFQACPQNSLMTGPSPPPPQMMVTNGPGMPIPMHIPWAPYSPVQTSPTGHQFGLESVPEYRMQESIPMAQPVLPLQPSQNSNSNNVVNPPSKRVRRIDQKSISCQQCGTTSTPEWRRGPEGFRTLCNACGLYHAKIVRKKGEAEAIRLLRKRRLNSSA